MKSLHKHIYQKLKVKGRIKDLFADGSISCEAAFCLFMRISGAKVTEWDGVPALMYWTSDAPFGARFVHFAFFENIGAFQMKKCAEYALSEIFNTENLCGEKPPFLLGLIPDRLTQAHKLARITGFERLCQADANLKGKNKQATLYILKNTEV